TALAWDGGRDASQRSPRHCSSCTSLRTSIAAVVDPVSCNTQHTRQEAQHGLDGQGALGGARPRHQRDQHHARPQPRRRQAAPGHAPQAPRGHRGTRRPVDQLADHFRQYGHRLPGPHAACAGQARRLEHGPALRGRPSHRRPPHRRRLLHRPRLRLQQGPRHPLRRRPLRVRLRAPRRGPLPRRRRPVQPALQRHRAGPQARVARQAELRDGAALPAELRTGRPRHHARRLHPRRQRPPPRRERLQGTGRGDPHGYDARQGQGGRGAEHQGHAECV
ncbi:hypothetical protein TCAP_03609, partial [Tolypocladium capitatum]